MNITYYDSAESIYTAFWNGVAERAEIDPAELEGAEIGFSQDGEEFSISKAAILDGMEAEKAWCFVDKDTGHIHTWFSAECPMEKRLFMLGHEIGHMQGTELDDDEAEEKRADEYGYAAAEAYRLLQMRQLTLH